jgi:Zn-dependent protease/predicted transcriptional regulator
MAKNQVTLFEIAGFAVKVDWSWAILAMLIAWSLAQGFFPSLYEGLPTAAYWWMGVAGVIGLFLSILLHELSHSVVARYYGLPIRGITLFIFGGVAELEEEPHSPRIEFRMAIAGPILSIALGVLFYLLTMLGQAAGWSEPVTGVTRYLASLNLILAVFNLIPAFPLDGGRVLRAYLWDRWRDMRRATRVAANAGIGFSLVLMGIGILSVVTGDFGTGIWWILIGLFLRSAAAGSYYDLRTRQAIKGRTVRDFMSGAPIAVSPTLSLRQLADDFVLRHHHEFFPVVEGGRVLGSISMKELKDIPRDRWEATTIAAAMLPATEANMIEAKVEAMAALLAMQRQKASRLMVVENGALVGVLSLKDLLKRLSLQLELEDAATGGG